MRLFLDANVLFTAAHNPKGKAAFVIELAEKGYWNVVTCALAVEEADRNLEAKFPSALAALRRLMRVLEVVPTIIEGNCPVALPDKDRPILLSAISANSSHLLTGDLKDFGRHMNQSRKTGGIVIQTVAEFLDAQV